MKTIAFPYGRSVSTKKDLSSFEGLQLKWTQLLRSLNEFVLSSNTSHLADHFSSLFAPVQLVHLKSISISLNVWLFWHFGWQTFANQNQNQSSLSSPALGWGSKFACRRPLWRAIEMLSCKKYAERLIDWLIGRQLQDELMGGVGFRKCGLMIRLQHGPGLGLGVKSCGLPLLCSLRQWGI